MKLYNIPSARKFLEKILECTGNIYKVQENGEPREMHKMARYLMETGFADQMEGIREINLVFERKDDVVAITNFAAEMN